MRLKVSHPEFVKAYLRCNGTAELAATLGISQQTVCKRIERLRKAGVNLPNFVRKKDFINADALNAMITKQAGSNGHES